MKKIPSTAITERQLIKKLRKAIKEVGSIREWSTDHGIISQQAGAFMRGTQGAGVKIPKALGYRPVIIFIPVDRKRNR